jgi:antitoxin component YwqK of YwqJK toxin-antitoxin module
MKAIISLILVVVSNTLLGQETRIEYYGKEGTKKIKEKSLYYVVTKDKYSDVDTIKSFYTKSNALHTFSVVNQKGIRNGLFQEIFQNGVMKTEGNYREGDPVDSFHTWYANGKPKSLEDFSKSILINYWDSTGSQLVKDGFGFLKGQYNAFDDDIYEEGKVHAGKKDSIWNGRLKSGASIVENYAAGELVSGTLEDEGMSFPYSKREETAAPYGGLPAFYSYVGKNIKFPPKAKKARINAKAFVQFVIERDGTITDVGIFKGIGLGCDEEVIRVVKAAPAWIAGKQFGKPVRQKMILPVQFKASWK